MKYLIRLVLICLFASQTFAKIEWPDFDRSMLRTGLGLERWDNEFDLKNQKWYSERNQEMLSFFRDLYYRNIEIAEKDHRTLRIPRIVHQIWLGSPIPERFHKWMATWARLKGWEYILWTEKEIDRLPMHNRFLYEQVTNFGEKSDIARLEILAHMGGVYVDVDFECLRPEIFEELHHSFDFYIGFEPLHHGATNKFNMFKVCNAILASCAHHPLLQDLIENLRANYLAYRDCCIAVQRTGPSYLTRIICEHELSGTDPFRNMYLPCTFFYPVSEPEMCYFFHNPKIPVEIAPETAGLHYWCGTWWKNNPFFQSVNIVNLLYTKQFE